MKTKNLLLTSILSFALTVSTFAQVPSYVPTSGLDAWFGFNGDANDLSGNGNNATNSGATFTSDRNGNANAAASFNGTTTNYMTIPTPSFTHSPTGAFTYSFWMNKQTQTTAAGIVLMSGTSTSGVFITLIQGASNFTFGTNKQQSSWFFLSCAHTLNVWDHYVTTFNAGVMKIYKNGVVQGTMTYTHTGATSANIPFYIGKGIASGNNFKGTLDDIGIWNRELSQTEITALFTGITGVEEANASTELTVYPNPAGEYIQLTVNPNAVGKNFRMLNTQGKIIAEGKLSTFNTRLDIRGFAAGMYFIELGEQYEQRYKFIKREE